MSDQPKKQELPQDGLPDYVIRYSIGTDQEGFSTGTLVPSDFGMWIPSVSVFRLQRELRSQLLAALSDNEAKDARIAELEKRCGVFMQGLDAEEKESDALHTLLEAAEAKLKSVEGLLKENSEPVSLLDCPPGMFLYNQNLGLKTEYTDPFGRIDVYVAESGEAFWGGVSDANKRDELMVHPVPADLLARIREAIK